MTEEKGNVVAEYRFKEGRVLISDSAYAGKTREELEAVRREARQVAWNIALGYEARRAGERDGT